MTAYFVKNGGNDTADGLSDANAWETIGKAMTEINLGTIIGGDSVSLNGGDSWVETPVFDFSADYSANPLVFNAYGTGFPTLISDSNRNMWFKGGSGGVTVDGIRCRWNTDFARNKGISMASGCFSITVQNCQFIGHSVALGPATSTITDISFIANVIVDAQLDGILGACNNLLIEGNILISCGYLVGSSGHCIYVGNNSETTPVTGVTIRDNLIINNRDPESGGSNNSVIASHGKVNNILIEGNHLIEERGTPFLGGRGIAVNEGGPLDDEFVGVIIRRNLIEGCGGDALNLDSCKNLEVYENVIVSSGLQDGSETITGVAIRDAGTTVTTDGVQVYNNVVYAKSGTGTQQAVDIDAEVLNVTRNENNVLVTYTEPLNFQLMSAPTKGALTAVGTDGSFTYEYEDGLVNDTDTFTYKIFDTNGISNTATATVNIVGGTTGKGYWAGGTTGSDTDEIDGIDFTDESAINPSAALSTARNRHGGAHSSVKGYFGGGHTNSTTNEIDGIQFSDESAINPAAVLAQVRASLAGVQSANDGYFAGGINAGAKQNEIDGIQFSDETAINPAAVLSVARDSLAGVASSSDGYFSGGNDGAMSSEIDGIQFSDETAINPSATLNTARESLAGVASATKGYFGGGRPSAVTDEIDGIQFSDETAINPVAVLATARDGLAGVYSEDKGYFGGGDAATGLSSEIDGIQFSDESAINPAATLIASRRQLAGVSYNP